MKAIERCIIAGAGLVLLLLFLYPPFMSVDPESGGRVHAALGHHAVWDPPSPEFVFRALYPTAPELPSAERLAGFVPRVNRVRLTIHTLAVLLICGLVVFILRRR